MLECMFIVLMFSSAIVISARALLASCLCAYRQDDHGFRDEDGLGQERADPAAPGVHPARAARAHAAAAANRAPVQRAAAPPPRSCAALRPAQRATARRGIVLHLRPTSFFVIIILYIQYYCT